MNLPDYRDTVVSLRVRADALQSQKDGAYAERDDYLRSFKDDGALLGLDPRRVALVGLVKHVKAISHLLQGTPGTEDLQSRILDAYNYIQLLNGLNQEELCK